MKASTVTIGALWCFAVGSAILGAQTPPPFPPMSNVMVATVVAMPFLFFGVNALWMKRSPFYHPALARFIDGRFGDGFLASFLVRLRPLLLFGTAAVLQALLGLVHVASGTAAAGALVPSLFFLSGGAGFFLAHLILYKRRMLGVHEQPVEAPPKVLAASVPAPLRDALRHYWWALLGVALFPAAAFIGGEVLHIPFEYFILPFFAVALLAAWPCVSGRAPYTFWLVAISVYMLGGAIAVMLLQVVRAVTV